ncbi:unnamed protein product [Arctogadus glacialis]
MSFMMYDLSGGETPMVRLECRHAAEVTAAGGRRRTSLSTGLPSPGPGDGHQTSTGAVWWPGGGLVVWWPGGGLVPRWRSGGPVEVWWPGGGLVARWRSGGLVEVWWPGGGLVARWRSGGPVEVWWPGGGLVARWRSGGPVELLTIDDDFCGLDMNAPLGVSEMVRGKPLFSDANDKMTSVIAYVYKNHSLVFVGTKGGFVKKMTSQVVNDDNKTIKRLRAP